MENVSNDTDPQALLVLHAHVDPRFLQISQLRFQPVCWQIVYSDGVGASGRARVMLTQSPSAPKLAFVQALPPHNGDRLQR